MSCFVQNPKIFSLLSWTSKERRKYSNLRNWNHRIFSLFFVLFFCLFVFSLKKIDIKWINCCSSSNNIIFNIIFKAELLNKPHKLINVCCRKYSKCRLCWIYWLVSIFYPFQYCMSNYNREMPIPSTFNMLIYCFVFFPLIWISPSPKYRCFDSKFEAHF